MSWKLTRDSAGEDLRMLDTLYHPVQKLTGLDTWQWNIMQNPDSDIGMLFQAHNLVFCDTLYPNALKATK